MLCWGGLLWWERYQARHCTRKESSIEKTKTIMAQYWRRLAIRESTKGLKLVESEMLHHDAHVTQHADSQICASEIATRSLTVLQCDEERQSTTCCLVRGTYVQCLIQSSLVPSRWWHRVIIIMTAQHDDFPVHTAHVNVGTLCRVFQEFAAMRLHVYIPKVPSCTQAPVLPTHAGCVDLPSRCRVQATIYQ